VTTTGQRLVEISQLSTGTAAQHLRAAGVTGSTAGELLVSYSQLPTATAIVHLLQTVQREAAGGVPKFRRMVTTPSVVAEAHFGWNVEFPSILLGLVPLPVTGVISPTVARTSVSVVNPQQKPNTACSTEPTASVSYSTWGMLLPSASASAPPTVKFPALSSSPDVYAVAHVVLEVAGAVSIDGAVLKPKSIRNPSEQEMIALLFS
jgi:hypothetical protein